MHAELLQAVLGADGTAQEVGLFSFEMHLIPADVPCVFPAAGVCTSVCIPARKLVLYLIQLQ
jgi:hypothetical protein